MKVRIYVHRPGSTNVADDFSELDLPQVPAKGEVVCDGPSVYLVDQVVWNRPTAVEGIVVTELHVRETTYSYPKP